MKWLEFTWLFEWLKIWLVCIVVAICYGIVHDQITVRLCLEYFTIGHRPLVPTSNPTLLALAWGVVATWWLGAILGLPTMLVMRVGKRPAWAVQKLYRPLLIYLDSVGLAASIFSLVGYLLARNDIIRLPKNMANKLPESALDPFIALGWAHSTSYAGGLIGACILWVWIWRQRRAGSPPIAEALPANRSNRSTIILLFLAIIWGCYLCLLYAFDQSFNDLYFPS